MINAAEMVLNDGVVSLSLLFKASFPNVTYHSVNAKRRLLQMPLVIFRVKKSEKRQSELFVMEKAEGFNYQGLISFLNKSLSQKSRPQGITREEIKQLLKITQSDRERECIRYAVYKASGATPTEARRLYGFDNMRTRAAHVETCLKEAQELYEAVDDMARIQDKALLDSMGLSNSSCSSDASSGEESDFLPPCDSCLHFDNGKSVEESKPVPSNFSLAVTLAESDFNWFEFVERVSIKEASLEQFFLDIPNLGFSEKQIQAVVQSHRAFLSSKSSYEERIARSINGEVVSESESDNPEQYVGIKDVMSQRGKAIVKKRRTAIRRRARRERAKALAERRFLSRKVSKRTSKIIRDCPDIGEKIELFVQEHNVGADKWRRTGVLTFDGNANIKEKVTYRKIQEHLKEIYGRNFAYGTVVELCVARNKHRR